MEANTHIYTADANVPVLNPAAVDGAAADTEFAAVVDESNAVAGVPETMPVCTLKVPDEPASQIPRDDSTGAVLPVVQNNGHAAVVKVNTSGNPAIADIAGGEEFSVAPPAKFIVVPPLGLPEDFEMNDTGLYAKVDRGKVKDIPVRICRPFNVVASLRDFDSKGHALKLAFTDRFGKLHEVNLPMADIATGKKTVIATLADRGIEFSADPKIRNGIFECLNSVMPPNDIRVATRAGWQRDDVFVLAGHAYGSAEPVELDHGLAAEQELSRLGTLDDWRNGPAQCAINNSRLLFAVSVALMGPLIRLEKAQSTLFNFHGPSSKGKTTAARLAASVWGRPSTDDGMIKTWRTTDNGLELMLKKFCDTLLVLDEMQAGEPDTVARAAHLIAGETGKTTMTQDRNAREVAKWRIAAISTAENPVSKVLAATKTGAQAGQLVRFVDIPAIASPDYGVFDSIGTFAGPGEFAEHVKSAALSAYGAAGPALVKAVVADIDAAKAAIRVDQTEFVARVLPKGADGQVERMSKSFALAATAGRLAARFGIAPWSEEDALRAAEVCFNAMLEGRGHAGSHELVSRVDTVRINLMKRLKSKFTQWAEVVKGDLSTRGEFGYIRVGKGKDDGLYVRLQLFKSEICAGFDHKPVLEELAKHGHLIRSNQGLSTVQRDPFDDKPDRFYKFHLNFPIGLFVPNQALHGRQILRLLQLRTLDHACVCILQHPHELKKR